MSDTKISALASYTPALDADVLPIVDTAGTTTKKISWANIKATLKTYFDGIYGAGTVTAVSVASANGFAGSSSGGATPALTLTTSINSPVLAGNGTAIAAATTTGSGTTAVLSTTPTFTTSVITPLVVGGTGTTGTQLSLQTTSGNGTTDQLVIKGGNNGATTFAAFTSGALTIGTTGALTTGTIELGAASDTTLSRASAGQMNIEGVQVDTVSNSVTLTNKTLTAPAMTTVAETGIGTADLLAPNNHAITVSSNAGSASQSFLVNTFTNSSAATMAITIPVATPTPKDGQFLEVRIYDSSGVAQTIGWTNTENSSVSAPTTSNGSTTHPLSVLFQYNGGTSLWRCVASS